MARRRARSGGPCRRYTAGLRTSGLSLLAALVVALCGAVPVAVAGGSSGTTAAASVQSIFAGPPAKLSVAKVRAAANGSANVSPVVGQHPLASWSLVFDRKGRTWRAVLQDVTSAVPLATVIISDDTGAVLSATVPSDTQTLPKRTSASVIAGGAKNPKIADWLHRYTSHGRQVTNRADFTAGTNGAPGTWVAHWWSGSDEIAQITMNDATGVYTNVWTGPQVAWGMARGGDGFGKKFNDPFILIPFVCAFVLVLFDYKRILSLRNLDVAMLASFLISLAFFDEGLLFWSVPFAYPPLVYFFCRMLAIGFGRRPRFAYTTRLPIWLVIGLSLFAIGFRAGMNVWNSGTLDVGFASVVGADRMLNGRNPYGTFPKPTDKPCDIKYSDGTYRAYIQADGACESAVAQGDTYGPVMYDAYVPATLIFPWSGKWDSLPGAHTTSIVFDVLAMLGLAVAGFRIAGRRLGASVMLLYAAFPMTDYSVAANSNDMVVAAIVAWMLALFTWPLARGFVLGLAAWAKFAPILILPLFLRGQRAPRRHFWELRTLLPDRDGRRVAAGFLAATVAAFVPIILLAGSLHGVRVFWNRTFGWQLDRPSPWSIWDWGVYPGLPDLSLEQKGLKALLVLLAIVVFVMARRLDVARIAALAGALLIGFQITLTHWSGLYIAWWVPCVAIALMAPLPAIPKGRRRDVEPSPELGTTYQAVGGALGSERETAQLS